MCVYWLNKFLFDCLYECEYEYWDGVRFWFRNCAFMFICMYWLICIKIEWIWFVYLFEFVYECWDCVGFWFQKYVLYDGCIGWFVYDCMNDWMNLVCLFIWIWIWVLELCRVQSFWIDLGLRVRVGLRKLGMRFNVMEVNFGSMMVGDSFHHSFINLHWMVISKFISSLTCLVWRFKAVFE